MKLYVCWGTFSTPGHKHPCQAADEALREAGYNPEVIKTYGFAPLPDFLNRGRKPVAELTGQKWVPALELDDGTGIADSKEIIAWARANPAAAAA